MRLSAQSRLTVIESVESREKTVSQVCREVGISRKTFYKWYKRFRQASKKNKLQALADNEWKLSRHPKKTYANVEKEVIKIVADNPVLGYKTLRKKLKQKLGEQAPGIHAIKNILIRHDLNKPETRLSFQQAKDKGLTEKERYLLFESILSEGKSVSRACREFGISRKTYYKWFKRYQYIKKLEAETFKNRVWQIKKHPKQISNCC